MEFRNRIVESYDSLFAGGNGGLNARANFGSKWGWYQSVYALADGDVTKFDEITELNVNTCLLMLTFKKEKADIEAQELKNRMR